ncbi:MAG TPA: sigma-70 family RNA polymerase sigma factor [Candidatus Acidoferrales bacterium]|nr:sigma-70 family RNA polymerase sigma factor [Candidatus Acidoferrales bacterium]
MAWRPVSDPIGINRAIKRDRLAMTDTPEPLADIVAFPAQASATDLALKDLELVYAFVYSKLGNRADAEDLTQQVALKALPRLREGAGAADVRGYLFTTARTVLASFWALRFLTPQAELADDLGNPTLVQEPNLTAIDRVTEILGALPENYRTVLELRFLRGYTSKEVAREVGTTVANVKIMQYRALRRAASLGGVSDE